MGIWADRRAESGEYHAYVWFYWDHHPPCRHRYFFTCHTQSFIGSLSLEPMVHGLSMVRNRKIIVLSCMCLCFCMSLYVSMKTHIAHCVHRQISIEIYLHACTLSHFSHVWLFLTLWTVAHQAPLSLGFSRQEHWGGLPCPGIEPVSFMSPALAGRFFTTSASWEVP